ncbi:MAG TPA: oligosaccharide flippase family protein [Prolixibacteraceae bacterium]|jgi:O-antigen/teichoic acid export membrane protein
MKATSIFGGVQVIVILIGIIKTKFIAIWLGTTGVGIIGLLNAPLGIITTLTGMGLSISAVREISEANGSGEELRIATTIKTLRRWVWFTGLLGMGITILSAPLLSNWSFGDFTYTWAFIFLSVTLLLTDINTGQKILLQGMRRIKHLAQATIIGAFLGLIISLPLYYYYGIYGIVPSLIIAAFSSLLLSWYYSRKINIIPIHNTYRDSYKDGLRMVKFGIILTFSGLIGTLIRYLISIYISRTGGIDQVGLYQAGFTLITGYVGIVFTAMSTDYFPRLAGTKNNIECSELINQQIEIAILIITPICVALTISLPIVIKVLYSDDFSAIIPMLEWVLIAVIVKTIVWAIGFLFLAKADFATSFKANNIMNIFLLFGYIGMYSIMGLQGIGIAEFILYCFGLLICFFFAQKKYNFRLNKNTIEISIISFIIAFSVFIVLKVLERNIISYIFSISLLIILSLFSIKNLNKRLDIISLLSKYNSP